MMNNKIIDNENLTKNLNKLYACDQIYSDAKIFFGLQIVFTVIFAIVSSIISSFYSSSFSIWFNITETEFKMTLVFISILITLIDKILISPEIIKLKLLAATIQEDFDCTVLDIPWNTVKIPNKPDSEVISKYSRRYLKKNNDRKNNWYYSSKLSSIPIDYARVICQKTNCNWDNRLRKYFLSFLDIVVFIVFIIVLILGFIKGLSLYSFFFNVVSPFLPLILFIYNQHSLNSASLSLSERLNNYSKSLWDKILNKSITQTDIQDQTRKVQDEIFRNRCTSPLVFNWFYRIFKSYQEEDSQFGCDELIDAYNESI